MLLHPPLAKTSTVCLNIVHGCSWPRALCPLSAVTWSRPPAPRRLSWAFWASQDPVEPSHLQADDHSASLLTPFPYYESRCVGTPPRPRAVVALQEFGAPLAMFRIDFPSPSLETYFLWIHSLIPMKPKCKYLAPSTCSIWVWIYFREMIAFTGDFTDFTAMKVWWMGSYLHVEPMMV